LLKVRGVPTEYRAMSAGTYVQNPSDSSISQRPVPISPPAPVLEQVDYAAARVDELAAEDRELNFVTDERTGRVLVQVCSLDGTVIREITGSDALDVMSGLLEL
jgi:uncharacterized FlaG/YvyC family protein